MTFFLHNVVGVRSLLGRRDDTLASLRGDDALDGKAAALHRVAQDRLDIDSSVHPPSIALEVKGVAMDGKCQDADEDQE